MDWNGIRTGFASELAKIAEFNLRGLSPETVMTKSQPPPPMETAGFDKARDILSRASQTKTAASRHVQRALPTTPGIGKLTHQGDDSSNEKAKSVAGYGLAGLGGGRAIAEFAHGPKMPNAATFHRNKWVGGAVGLAAGAGYGMLRAHQKAQMAKQGMSPEAKMLVGMGGAGLLAGGLGHQAGLKRGRKEADEVLENAQKYGQEPKRWPLSKKSEITKLSSPAQALKASQQVGKVKITPSAHGPSTTTQIRGQLIGRKGIP